MSGHVEKMSPAEALAAYREGQLTPPREAASMRNAERARARRLDRPEGFFITIVDDGESWTLACPAAGVDATSASVPAALRKLAKAWSERAPAPLLRGYEPKQSKESA